jgi:hypothetical protein
LDQKYIFIYADNFTPEEWAVYCSILDVPKYSTKLKLFISNVESSEEEL